MTEMAAMAEMHDMSTRCIEKVFKVLIVGDPSVGKTSFVQRYVYNTFNRHYKGTVGVDFALKVLHWADSITVKLQLWDIAGQEKFSWMTRVYYKDSHGCLILFDLSNRNTLTNAIKWKTDVDSLCTGPDGRKLPCILIANKCDIPDSEKQVTREELDEISNQYQFSGWMETSAKEGIMVNESLRSLTTLMLLEERNYRETAQNITLTASGSPTRKCC